MRMKMKFILAFVLSIYFIPIAHSGDYSLTISDDPNAPCAPPIASRENRSYPIRTSSEIAQDIHRYFRGKQPELRMFVGAFGNAHIRFCSPQERETVFRAFLAVIRFDKIEHEGHLYDYIMMLGNRLLLKMIEAELSRENTTVVQKRLDRAHAALLNRYE